MQCQALQVNPTPQLLHGDKELTQGAYERIYKALGRETIIKIMGPSCSRRPVLALYNWLLSNSHLQEDLVRRERTFSF